MFYVYAPAPDFAKYLGRQLLALSSHLTCPPTVCDLVCTSTVAVVVDDSSAGVGVAESKGGDGEAGGPSQELPDPNYVPEVRLDWTLTVFTVLVSSLIRRSHSISFTRAQGIPKYLQDTVDVPESFPTADSGPKKPFHCTFSRATYPTQLTSAAVLPVL